MEVVKDSIDTLSSFDFQFLYAFNRIIFDRANKNDYTNISD